MSLRLDLRLDFALEALEVPWRLFSFVIYLTPLALGYLGRRVASGIRVSTHFYKCVCV